MTIADEFAESYNALSENEQRGVTIWLALHRDFPESFPLFDLTDNPALLSLAKFIDLFTGERSPVR